MKVKEGGFVLIIPFIHRCDSMYRVGTGYSLITAAPVCNICNICNTVRAVHRVLEHRYHGNRWPSTKLLLSQLQSWIVKRINEASGSYQMFEVLGDLILLHGYDVSGVLN